MIDSAERGISEVLETLDATDWEGPVATNMRASACEALEDGKVLFFPRLAFELDPGEKLFLSPTVVDEKSKSISFDCRTQTLKHAVGTERDITAIAAMMRRYHDDARQFLQHLLPGYTAALESGRTSFRPVEIRGRKLSARKDDTRLHVDAFPSTPTGGKRILRVFSNVNPSGEGRAWRLGAPFNDVARKFMPGAKPPIPGSAWFLSAIGATNARRTPYDHVMLNIHDTMKMDDAYQAHVAGIDFSFPPGSTWVVYTDKTSHAAMGGQHLFEQTFYLPVSAMADQSKAPIRVLENLAGRKLA